MSQMTGAVLALYANRDKPATHTRYDFVEYIGRVAIGFSPNNLRYKRQLPVTSIQKEFIKNLDSGLWFFNVFNDGPLPIDLSIELSLASNDDPLCPANCHGHGMCVAGVCKCDPGFSGDACDLSKCFFIFSIFSFSNFYIIYS